MFLYGQQEAPWMATDPKVWVLYGEGDPPHLDECPCACTIRTRYDEDGRPVSGSSQEKHMGAEVIPCAIQKLDWTSMPASCDDLPANATGHRVLDVLKAIPQQEAGP